RHTIGFGHHIVDQKEIWHSFPDVFDCRVRAIDALGGESTGPQHSTEQFQSIGLIINDENVFTISLGHGFLLLSGTRKRCGSPLIVLKMGLYEERARLLMLLEAPGSSFVPSSPDCRRAARSFPPSLPRHPLERRRASASASARPCGFPKPQNRSRFFSP